MQSDEPVNDVTKTARGEAFAALLRERGWPVRYAMPFSLRGELNRFRYGGGDACWMWHPGHMIGSLHLGGVMVGHVKYGGDGRHWHDPLHGGRWWAVDYEFTDHGLQWSHAFSGDPAPLPLALMHNPRQLRSVLEQAQWAHWGRVERGRGTWQRLRELLGVLLGIARARLVPRRFPMPDAGVQRETGEGIHRLTFGGGLADPKMARAELPVRIAKEAKTHTFRTAWAFEAVRLAGGYHGARRSWDEDRPLHGPRLRPHEREGRFAPPLAAPAESELPTVPMLGMSHRLQGVDLDEDVDIALIEGVYYNLPSPEVEDPDAGLVFERWLDDPRPRVRYTALRRFRTLPSPGIVERLAAMAGDADPIIREHVQDALERRTWVPEPRRTSAGAPGSEAVSR